MHTSTSFQIFEKKLLVVEPRRSMILAEVQQRINDSGESTEESENPISLARMYDRRTLGFIHSPFRAALFGILSLLLLSVFFAHGYFEQWVWKLYAWIRYYHFDWWEPYVVLEGVIEWTGIALYLFVALPMMARSIIRSSQPLRLVLSFIGSMYLAIAILYAISKFTVTGRDKLENVLRDIGGTQPSILFALTLYVLFPLALIVLGMLWRKRRTKPA